MRLAWLVAGAMVLTSVLAASGCSVPDVPESNEKTGAVAQSIQNGSTDDTHKFAVGVSMGAGLCSGALILPNVVATARHCVDQSPQLIDCGKNPTFGARKSGPFRVTTNTNMFSGGGSAGWYGVKAVAVPDDDHICGNDIALLVLSQSVPESVTKPITPGVQYLMWDPDHYKPAFRGIGYGNTSPEGEGSGTRRISKPISVLCIPGSPDRPCPKEFSPKEFVGGDGPCSGDSGSSAFEYGSLTSGAPVSFGVLSRGGESDDGKECLGSAYTRFDAHRDFVLEVAKAASEDWTLYDEPSWTAYKPPPVVKPQDAGSDSGPSTEPSGLGLGETCETDEECTSGLCSDSGDGSFICSRECDEAKTSSCPKGFECRESLCLPPVTPAEPAAGPKTITQTTCSASPGISASATSWGWAALAAATALGAVRRRKR